MFVRLVFAVLLLAAPAAAETFVFPRHGVAIDAPEGWTVIGAADLIQMADGSDFGDELKQAARGQNQSLLLSAVRDWPVIGVTPGLHLNVYPYQVGSIPDGLAQVATYLARNTQRFELLVEAADDQLGPFKAGYMIYRYHVVSNGEAYDVEEKFWLIPLGDHYLTLSSGYAPDEGAPARAAIEAAAKSLRRQP